MSRRMRPTSMPSTATPAPRRATPGSPGRPLDPATRAELEPRFRHDFGHVRVHTDNEAAAAARAMDARAYTVDTDVAFGAGQYAPESAAGRELIAHELAHVVQQDRGGTTPDAEARADAGASRAMRGGAVDAALLGGAPVGVQAKPDEPATAAPKEAVDVVPGADLAAPASSATVLDRFVRDKSALTKKHLDAIDQVAFSVWLHLSPYADAKATIAITGHTDTTGTEKHNSGLSSGARREHEGRARGRAEEARGRRGQARADRCDGGRRGEASHPDRRRGGRAGQPARGDRGHDRGEGSAVTEGAGDQAAPRHAGRAEDLGGPGGDGAHRIRGTPPPAPRVPTNKGEWLKDALERDPLLKKLPKKLREKAIDALKDADEKVVDAIIDAAPFDGEYKEAAKAAAKALLQTLKGRNSSRRPSRRAASQRTCSGRRASRRPPGNSSSSCRRFGAQAFTVGGDVFFDAGAYAPGTTLGRRLIAHELAHVAQQGAAPPVAGAQSMRFSVAPAGLVERAPAATASPPASPNLQPCDPASKFAVREAVGAAQRRAGEVAERLDTFRRPKVRRVFRRIFGDKSAAARSAVLAPLQRIARLELSWVSANWPKEATTGDPLFLGCPSDQQANCVAGADAFYLPPEGNSPHSLWFCPKYLRDTNGAVITVEPGSAPALAREFTALHEMLHMVLSPGAVDVVSGQPALSPAEADRANRCDESFPGDGQPRQHRPVRLPVARHRVGRRRRREPPGAG